MQLNEEGEEELARRLRAELAAQYIIARLAMETVDGPSPSPEQPPAEPQQPPSLEAKKQQPQPQQQLPPQQQQQQGAAREGAVGPDSSMPSSLDNSLGSTGSIGSSAGSDVAEPRPGRRVVVILKQHGMGAQPRLGRQTSATSTSTPPPKPERLLPGWAHASPSVRTWCVTHDRRRVGQPDHPQAGGPGTAAPSPAQAPVELRRLHEEHRRAGGAAFERVVGRSRRAVSSSRERGGDEDEKVGWW